MTIRMKAIQRRIQAVQSTEKITETMELVSGARLHQMKILNGYVRGPLDRLKIAMESMINREELVPERWKKEGKGVPLHIIFTGYRGLCGSYNAAVERFAERHIDGQRDKLLFLGAHGAGYFTSRAYREYRPAEEIGARQKREAQGLERPGLRPNDEISWEELRHLAEKIFQAFLRGNFCRVDMFYNAWQNSIESRPIRQTLLPFVREEREAYAEDPVLYECDKGNDSLQGLAETYLTLRLHAVIAESSLCEYSARRMAMKNATDTAKEMIETLKTEYNRARQEVITREIIEISSGSEVLKKKTREAR